MKRRTFTYAWPRPALTVDVALFRVAGKLGEQRLEGLLIQRLAEPFAGAWALPGGFVHEHEDLADAAARELEEESGVAGVFLEQVASIGTPGRDPRGHTVTVLHVALVPADRFALAASGDAGEARWFPVSDLPELAFDHARLLDMALEHLRRRLGESPVCFELLPARFTLSELQELCEVILGRALDRRNFRRKLAEAGFLSAAKGAMRTGAHRPAQLFTFSPQRFRSYMARGRALPFR